MQKNRYLHIISKVTSESEKSPDEAVNRKVETNAELMRELEYMVNTASKIIVIALLLLTILCIALNQFMSSNFASVIGGALGALATCALGLLAFWQNKQYKRLADEKNAQLEQVFFTPESILLKVRLHFNTYSTAPILDVMFGDNNSTVYFDMYNRSTSQPMIHLLVGEVVFQEDSLDERRVLKYPRGQFKSSNQEIEYLDSNSEFRVGFQLPSDLTDTSVVCKVVLQYASIYNYKYQKHCLLNTYQGVQME